MEGRGPSKARPAPTGRVPGLLESSGRKRSPDRCPEFVAGVQRVGASSTCTSESSGSFLSETKVGATWVSAQAPGWRPGPSALLTLSLCPESPQEGPGHSPQTVHPGHRAAKKTMAGKGATAGGASRSVEGCRCQPCSGQRVGTAGSPPETALVSRESRQGQVSQLLCSGSPRHPTWAMGWSAPGAPRKPAD